MRLQLRIGFRFLDPPRFYKDLLTRARVVTLSLYLSRWHITNHRLFDRLFLAQRSYDLLLNEILDTLAIGSACDKIDISYL